MSKAQDILNTRYAIGYGKGEIDEAAAAKFVDQAAGATPEQIRLAVTRIHSMLERGEKMANVSLETMAAAADRLEAMI